MSNQAVGGVYQTIIEEVINSSRVDFEESGVEESVLEELRKGWQQKLSQLDVATFPWDPKPDVPPPAPKAAPPPAAAAAGNHSQAQFSPQVSLPNAAATAPNGVKPEPSYMKQENGQPIKQEPGAQPAGVPAYPIYNGMDGQNSVAASRAQQQLQAQYGNRAAGSISAIQDRMGQQVQPQQQAQVQAGQQAQQQAYRPPQPNMMNQQQQQQQPPAPGQAFRNGQMDGAGDMDSEEDDDDDDFEGVLLQRTAGGDVHELGRVDIDRLMHKRMAANARSMEAGGLMLTLKEATKDQSQLAHPASSKRKGKGVAAFDGGDDDEEDDEDAINSDLDDPDEDRDDDEVDDEGLGHIMLCMYDKVQRVKNKWKCTLKDGVLTVNGKEYVFHKATGEYEW